MCTPQCVSSMFVCLYVRVLSLSRLNRAGSYIWSKSVTGIQDLTDQVTLSMFCVVDGVLVKL